MVKTARQRKSRSESSLAQAAYEQIKRAIIGGELRGGEYLNVARLCARLKLGRSPVHQAVQRLAADGFIEIQPRKGVSIRGESLEDSLEIDEARSLLFTALAGLAARRADGQAIARMERLLLELKPAKNPDRAAMMAIDLAFHAELFAAAGNQILAQMARRVHERAVRLLYSSHQSMAHITARIERLRPVLLAIRNGDESGAMTAMRRQIENVVEERPSAAGSAVA